MKSKILKLLVFVVALGIVSAIFVGTDSTGSSDTAEDTADIAVDTADIADDTADGCTDLPATANTQRIAQIVGDSTMIYTGPGTDFPTHESGVLYAAEGLQVLQECDGWVQGRVIPAKFVETVIAQNGPERATAMLTFWLPADQLQ